MQHLLNQRRTNPSREVDSGLFHKQPQCRLCVSQIFTNHNLCDQVLINCLHDWCMIHVSTLRAAQNRVTQDIRTLWLWSLPSVSTNAALFLFCSSLLSFPPGSWMPCILFLFAHSWASLWILGSTFPKQIINITSHCNGVIFMEAPEEVTWLWLVPWGPGASIKLVLTHISINDVEKLRKYPSFRAGCCVFQSTYLVNGARRFSPSLVLGELFLNCGLQKEPTHVCVYIDPPH